MKHGSSFIYFNVAYAIGLICFLILFYFNIQIIFLTNLEIGYITPPIGINLFISSFRFDRSVIELYKSTFPFLILLIFALLLITFIPELSLFLLG